MRSLRSGRLLGAVGLISASALLAGCSSTSTALPTDHVDRELASQTSAAAQAAMDRQVRVSVIGDSFSAGQDNDVVWPDVLAEEHGIRVANVSLGGSGYVAGDDYLGTFADQVALATEERPSVILVVGSENDVDADPDDVLTNAEDLYDGLRRRSPDARIVVIGPIWTGGPVAESMWDVDAAVEAAATSAGLEFVDTLDKGWLADPTLIQEDGDHPTDEGQYLLAGHIDDALVGLDPDLLG
ncbi:MAG: SGNH/GDSL hydrolase family protein [Rhodococcus sp. (in: high G+C Gram-positive bacteria)]